MKDLKAVMTMPEAPQHTFLAFPCDGSSNPTFVSFLIRRRNGHTQIGFYFAALVVTLKGATNALVEPEIIPNLLNLQQLGSKNYQQHHNFI